MRSKFSLTDPREKPRLDDLLPYGDVVFELTITVGRTAMTIGNLIKLERGDIVELNNSAGESLEVYANDKLVAKGDVTVIEDRFAIRLTEIFNPNLVRK